MKYTTHCRCNIAQWNTWMWTSSLWSNNYFSLLLLLGLCQSPPSHCLARFKLIGSHRLVGLVWRHWLLVLMGCGGWLSWCVGIRCFVMVAHFDNGLQWLILLLLMQHILWKSPPSHHDLTCCWCHLQLSVLPWLNHINNSLQDCNTYPIRRWIIKGWIHIYNVHWYWLIFEAFRYSLAPKGQC
jgi:hypothetical protein